MASTGGWRRTVLVALLLVACSGPVAPQAPPAPAAGSGADPVSAAACHLVAGGARPDPECTPGAINREVTPDPAVLGRTVCRPGWTNTVRPADSAALKRQVLLRYGIAVDQSSLARYEMDHRVPLEIGGAPRDLANLWPEPWEKDSRHPEGNAAPGAGAQSKDKVENRVRAEICNGRIGLQEGQKVFLGDWWSS